MSVTRVFRLRATERGREPINNEATAMVENPLLRADSTGDDGAFDAKKLFIERYPIIKKALAAHKKQGVLIFAFDKGRVALGQAWLAASLDRTRAAIIGRHSMCNLAVSSAHDRVSLRHLAVLIRAVSHSEVRIRVLDLHTQTGFTDESGRVLQAATSEGSVFLRIGDVSLVMLVTSEDGEVLDDAEAAYACIPPRVFLEERPGTAGAPEPRHTNGLVPALPIAPSTTIVRSQAGPLAAAGNLCRDDEPPFGTLIVRAGGGSVRRPVGQSILERGLLVGRYARCDVGLAVDEDSRLSRVHLLVLKDGADVVGIDTASVNGTYAHEKAILLHKLDEGTILDLGGELELAWHYER